MLRRRERFSCRCPKGALMRKKMAMLVALPVLAVALLAADHPDRFVVRSPDVADGGMLSAANAGTGASTRGNWACGGRNVSLALAWSHAPAGTNSFAVLMDDPDAASGIGANHWIAYGIPATTSALPRAAGNAGSPLLVSGLNGRKAPAYFGPCAEPGAKAHHFLWTVFALDLAPHALPAGLSRAAFMRRIRGHNLAEASLVTRYERPRAQR
jgi:Raf kinase inhibitor-like YbhB/YbcL family protein